MVLGKVLKKEIHNIQRPRLLVFWMLAFAYSCLVALAVQKLFLPMMPELHGRAAMLTEHFALRL